MEKRLFQHRCSEINGRSEKILDYCGLKVMKSGVIKIEVIADRRFKIKSVQIARKIVLFFETEIILTEVKVDMTDISFMVGFLTCHKNKNNFL